MTSLFGDPMWSIIGALGLLFIELSYVPQIARLFRLQEADHISLVFPGLNLVGRLLALSYSMHIGDAVFGAGLMLGVLLRATLFSQVLWYRVLRDRVKAKFPRPVVLVEERAR